MLNFHKLYSFDYLFTVNRISLTRSDKIFFVLAMGFVLLAIVLKIAAHYAPSQVDKKYRDKFYGLFLTAGLLEMFWFAMRYQDIRFFGSHFLALIILLIGLI